MRACVCARACVRACVIARARVCVCVCVSVQGTAHVSAVVKVKLWQLQPKFSVIYRLTINRLVQYDLLGYSKFPQYLHAISSALVHTVLS